MPGVLDDQFSLSPPCAPKAGRAPACPPWRRPSPNPGAEGKTGPRRTPASRAAQPAAGSQRGAREHLEVLQRATQQRRPGRTGETELIGDICQVSRTLVSLSVSSPRPNNAGRATEISRFTRGARSGRRTGPTPATSRPRPAAGASSRALKAPAAFAPPSSPATSSLGAATTRLPSGPCGPVVLGSIRRTRRRRQDRNRGWALNEGSHPGPLR